MLDQSDSAIAVGTGAAGLAHYDLVVVGAGIAGLNALYSAAQYMPAGASALLIDQKDAAGGMWNVAYDYVRLHQPHPMFTVGDMQWNWSKPRHYLAARDEVQAHLASALGPIGQKLSLHTAFGQTVTSVDEVEKDGGHQARITFHANGHPAQSTTITADRAIHAPGLNFIQAEPLPLSSQDVVAGTPATLRRDLQDHPGAHVFVIGGGKTGMDTIAEVLKARPAHPVTLLKGQGTNFFSRDANLPTGLKRWTSGRPTSQVFRDIAMRFDGNNEDAVAAYFKQTYATGGPSDNQQFFYGVLSESELRTINAGLSATYADYLTDVIDGPDGPVLIMRSGDKLPIPKGSLIVNCTGNIFRTKKVAPAEPCLSPQGRILSVNARDSMHFLSSVSGYFLPHLWLRGVLKDSGIFTLDNEDLFRKNRVAWIAATSTQAHLNLLTLMDALPLSVLDKCGLDFDKWYPLPRRLAGVIRLKSNAKAEKAHCRRNLLRLAERFDTPIGPIGGGA